MVIDDQLNILPISSHTLSITALPPKSKVKIIIPVFLVQWSGSFVVYDFSCCG